MKTCLFFASSIAGKGLKTEFEDLSNISNQLNTLFTERSSVASVELQDEILKWAYDAYDASQASRSEISNKDIRTILAKGNVMNLHAMISFLIGPEANEVERGSTPQNKYASYGCYCSPHQEQMSDGNWVGKGEPVDEIDATCKQLWYGYKCLTKDYGDECDSSKSYNWEITDQGELKCLEKKGTCKGDLCRLDLEFTTKIQSLADTWLSDFHLDYGFDRETDCKGTTNSYDNSSKNPSPRPPKPTVETECCGKGLKRHIFNPERLQCCKDGTTKSIGSCKL